MEEALDLSSDRILNELMNVQSKRTTRAEPEDHLWSADHSLGNAGLDEWR